MSRYVSDYEPRDGAPPWEFWAQAVANATKGKRGQAFLRELRKALLAMPDKRLIAGDMITPTGEVCALGQFAVYKGKAAELRQSFIFQNEGEEYTEEEDLSESANWVAYRFNVPTCLAFDVAYANDEEFHYDTPEARWRLMLQWIDARLLVPA